MQETGAPARGRPRDDAGSEGRRAEEELPTTSVARGSGLPAAIGLVVSGIFLFMIAPFALSHRSWEIAFLEDAWRWLRDPTVAGGWHTPTGWFVAIPLMGAMGLEGWSAARLLLSRSSLQGEPLLELGLTLVMSISIAGFGSLICVTVGELGRPQLLGFYGLTGSVLAWMTWRRSRTATGGEVASVPRSTGIRRFVRGVTYAVIGVVVLSSLVHATLTPVTEWDATIYHAETARLWFLERPDPAVRYGPSIGIEISSNYPPLFPAAGAAIYTVVGAFDDIYLRVLPPLLLAALLLMLFGYARRRFEGLTADLVVLIVAASPLTLAYGVWTTGYILLLALIVAVVILVDIAAESNHTGAWIGAGAVAGLAILSHFYGLLALLPAGAVLLTWRRRPRPVRGALLFGMTALLVASPWLLRNLVLLHDPFYPLGTPPFPGKGLIEPFWSASKIGIKSKALSYWGGAAGPFLTVREFATSLFDRQLLLTTAYFGLWYGIVSWRRRPRAAYLAAVLLGGIIALLLPGWYWLRAAVPLVPLGALLTADLLSTMLVPSDDPVAARGRLLVKVARGSAVAATGATVIVCSIVGVSLSIAGPNQRAMVGVPGDQVLGSVRALGAPRDQLWTAFNGDLLMWEWLDQYIAEGERFATLEIRTYYLARPDAVFYLDGIEAAPLIDLDDPVGAERFLTERHIRYIVMPSWAVHEATADSIAGILPLFGFLGDRHFPAVAAFPVGRSEQPSVVYSVGPVRDDVRVGFATSAQGVAPALDQADVVFPARDVANRIFVPSSRSEPVALRFRYNSHARFHLSMITASDTWVLRRIDASLTGGIWRTAVVPLPADRDAMVDLGVYVRRGDLEMRGVRLTHPDAPLIDAPHRQPTDGATAFRLPDPTGARIYVPVSEGRGSLRFEYRDRGRGTLQISVRHGGEFEEVQRIQLNGSGRWIAAAVPLGTVVPGFAEVWLRPSSGPLLVRAVRSA